MRFFDSSRNKCSMYFLLFGSSTDPMYVVLVVMPLLAITRDVLSGDFDDDVVEPSLIVSNGRYKAAQAQTCNIHPPNIRIVPWNPKLCTKCSIKVGNTNEPAAVPDTHIPLARARCLSKYNETMIIPGVVLKPPPIPVECTMYKWRCALTSLCDTLTGQYSKCEKQMIQAGRKIT